jgi:hypothetical protein
MSSPGGSWKTLAHSLIQKRGSALGNIQAIPLFSHGDGEEQIAPPYRKTLEPRSLLPQKKNNPFPQRNLPGKSPTFRYGGIGREGMV